MSTAPSRRRQRQALAAAGLAVCSVLCLFGGTASAQQPGPGVRAGVSVDPDQFYFGVHFDTGPIIDRLSFRPNVEAGLGDSRTLVGFNFEFAYTLPLPQKAWSLYVGGGPAAVITKVDHDAESDTDVGGGFNLLIGIAHHKGLFAELKVGALDSPSLKIGVGYAF